MHLNSTVFIILFLEALVKEISWKLDVIRNLNIHALQQISLFLLHCEIKKRKIRTININYTFREKNSMEKLEFLFKRVLFIYFFFIRFTYFNTVAQTFYILINSQEVSRKSRVSCTSILNLFFFLNVPYSNCVCSLFYTVHFCTFLSPWYPSIEGKRESNVFIWIYYFGLTYFNLSQCYRYVYSFQPIPYALEISKFIIFTFSISNCIIDRGIRSKRLSIHTRQSMQKFHKFHFSQSS